MGKKWMSMLCMICSFVWILPMERVSAQNEAIGLLVQKYEEYQENFAHIEKTEDIEDSGFEKIENHTFSVVLESFGEEEVRFVPIMHREYHRLAVLITDGEGKVLFKTDQLETNYRRREQLEQPTKDLAAVSFQDLNQDGLTDIVLITNCENDTGEYAGRNYKVGDVLFQGEGEFYRDWRISDKINRFSMNKSADFIASYVRDGNSTEILYTATTLEELLENGFRIIKEQDYSRNFEKQGKLRVVPGIIRMAEYDVFMIYL